MRVQIPAYTDRWMMGDRFGEVVAFRGTTDKPIAHVKLDKSGKVIRVIADDCEII